MVDPIHRFHRVGEYGWNELLKDLQDLAEEVKQLRSQVDNIEQIPGPPGEPGSPGIDGDDSIIPGPPGEPGQPGQQGEQGQSAYELAQSYGFTGTEEQYLALIENVPQADEMWGFIDTDWGRIKDTPIERIDYGMINLDSTAGSSAPGGAILFEEGGYFLIQEEGNYYVQEEEFV